MCQRQVPKSRATQHADESGIPTTHRGSPRKQQAYQLLPASEDLLAVLPNQATRAIVGQVAFPACNTSVACKDQVLLGEGNLNCPCMIHFIQVLLLLTYASASQPYTHMHVGASNSNPKLALKEGYLEYAPTDTNSNTLMHVQCTHAGANMLLGHDRMGSTVWANYRRVSGPAHCNVKSKPALLTVRAFMCSRNSKPHAPSHASNQCAQQHHMTCGRKLPTLRHKQLQKQHA